MLSVIAATVPCMARTLPVYGNNSTTFADPKQVLVEEKYMNGKYILKYYISGEVSANKNYRSVTKMDLHPTRISEPYHKSSKTSKSNRQGRKHHHIHQPGRTNCTQRYQRK
tara:strand:+ start:114 stop:446 length:333 start_codon:yes stop_codon:yes gene_type:complete